MRLPTPSLSALALVSSLLLAACGGGGGNESGPIDEIRATPAGVSVLGANSTVCAVGAGPTVFLYGGQPPYKLVNTWPAAMQLDRTVVPKSGEGFTVTYLNGTCFTNLPITVQDDMGRLLEVMFSNTPGNT
ncbi:hypothetical protein [Ideonella sp.]|uniref:hypothetical protein n=1 Tax=Ideonella sp. TaxID=1929293 RepID=UPI003BB73F05